MPDLPVICFDTLSACMIQMKIPGQNIFWLINNFLFARSFSLDFHFVQLWACLKMAWSSDKVLWHHTQIYFICTGCCTWSVTLYFLLTIPFHFNSKDQIHEEAYYLYFETVSRYCCLQRCRGRNFPVEYIQIFSFFLYVLQHIQECIFGKVEWSDELWFVFF